MRRWIRWIPTAGIPPSSTGQQQWGQGRKPPPCHPVAAGSQASGECGSTGRTGRSWRQQVPPCTEHVNPRWQHLEGTGDGSEGAGDRSKGAGDRSDLPQGRHDARGLSPPHGIVPWGSGKHHGQISDGRTRRCLTPSLPEPELGSQQRLCFAKAGTQCPAKLLLSTAVQSCRAAPLREGTLQVPLLAHAAACLETAVLMLCLGISPDQKWEEPKEGEENPIQLDALGSWFGTQITRKCWFFPHEVRS